MHKCSNAQSVWVDTSTCILHTHTHTHTQDPGISNTQPRGSYEPYDMGVEMDIFVKNSSNQLLIGRVSVQALYIKINIKPVLQNQTPFNFKGMAQYYSLPRFHQPSHKQLLDDTN